VTKLPRSSTRDIYKNFFSLLAERGFLLTDRNSSLLFSSILLHSSIESNSLSFRVSVVLLPS